MTKNSVLMLAVVFLAACAPSAKSQESPLCNVGRSILDLAYLQSSGADARIQPSILRASLVFLAECPKSVIPALREFGEHEAAFRQAWLRAIRSAAHDTSEVDARVLLALAKPRLTEESARAIKEYLDPAYDGLDDRVVDSRTLARLMDNQALASLRAYSQCDGVGCFDASDNLLFMLGTYPVALAKAMRSESADARKWLRLVGDQSFSGDPERARIREAARRSLVSRLSRIKAVEFEPELRACENTLRSIRYEPVR